MICSSSTTSRPDPRRGTRFSLVATALAALLALPVAADGGQVERAVGEARIALADGDGVAAEARLRDARRAGASADDVRALMGEALLAQDDLLRARKWLTQGSFPAGSRGLGYRMLGRLEWRERRLPEAGRAFDRALAETPDDAQLWTDIARLRYTGGEQAQAIAAADRAVALDPANAGGLWFRGLLVRQQIGYQAALPWFDAALAKAPDDPAILLDRAATAIELGRYTQALVDIRAAHDAAPSSPKIIYQQAVIAARSGNRELARRLLERSKGSLRDVPGAILLGAALELDAGNVNQAIETADRLLRYQPDNQLAQNLLARAMLRSGDSEGVAARFGSLAAAENVSPYLATIVARALEERGRRDEAVVLLAKASRSIRAGQTILPAGADLPVLAARYPDAPKQATQAVPYMRAALGLGQASAAAAAADRLFEANPGAPAAAEMAGDGASALGQSRRALDAYQTAARIEFGESEFLRVERALRTVGRSRDADLLIVAFATEHPQNLAAVRMLANLRARSQQWPEAVRLLSWLDRRSGKRDPVVLADWAFAMLESGQRGDLPAIVERAVRLQPANMSVRQSNRLLVR